MSSSFSIQTARLAYPTCMEVPSGPASAKWQVVSDIMLVICPDLPTLLVWKSPLLHPWNQVTSGVKCPAWYLSRLLGCQNTMSGNRCRKKNKFPFELVQMLKFLLNQTGPTKKTLNLFSLKSLATVLWYILYIYIYFFLIGCVNFQFLYFIKFFLRWHDFTQKNK